MHGPGKRPYRLGLDLGSNSAGWFVVWLEKRGDRYEAVGLGPGGVRIFPDGRDPQSGTSNAVDRRMARSAHKRRDRFLQRQRGLIKALTKHGLFPADTAARKALERLDPYALRASALADALPAHHVGRALFHVNQRRGFLSNRKAERKKDSENGAIKLGEERLKEAMGEKKLGQFLAEKHLPDALAQRQEVIRTELKRLSKDHLTGNARKKAWAKIRKRLFGEETFDAPREGVRARATITGTKASYDFYPTREILKDEFNAIWSAQTSHHPSMTPDAKAEIEHLIFHQRPLKDPIVGKCTLDPATLPADKDPEGYRAPWAHPLAQRFRILQEARNLEVQETGKGSRRLTKEQGDQVVMALLGQKAVSFDKLRSLLKLSTEAKFNIESERRTELLGDQVAARLADKKGFGKAWRNFPIERQSEIVGKLLDMEDESELLHWLETECGLDAAAAARVANTPLPESHCRLGLRAIKKIVPIMENDLDDDGVSGVGYYEAAKRAGYDHAKLPDGVLSSNGYLPYYGEWLHDAVVGSGDVRDAKERKFGQFPNPTVHIGLGQVRRVVNDLIREYGPPTEISIEFTRALKLSPKQKAQKESEQRLNQIKNEDRKKLIREVMGENYDPTPRDLLKMRLWQELGSGDGLDRKCPYTGESIGVRRLLSADVDIDHILPFAMTLDDSAANKTICIRQANRDKRKQTPYEAFGSNPGGYRWEDIAARATMLPKNKRWRFDPNAREEFEKRGGFIARQLNETGWLARLAKQYLGAVTDPYQIWVVPGRLTSMIRGKWGLNGLLPSDNYAGVKDKDDAFLANTNDMEFSGVKNRADHRHHAIDALVAALTDRSLLWKMASSYDEEREKIDIPTPWDKDRLRGELKASLEKMVVAHRADHGVGGKLHEDTAYGFVKKPEKEGGKFFVRRKPIESLTPKEAANIRDVRLRQMVEAHIAKEKAKGIDAKAALLTFRDKHAGDAHIKHGVHSVRVLVSENPEYTVSIKNHRTERAYKAYAAGENLFVDIFEDAKGRWHGAAVTRFQANQVRGVITPNVPSGCKHVMRVFKNDLLAVDVKGVRTIMVVRQLDAAARRFKLAPHNETGNLQARHDTDNEIDPFRWLIASYNVLKGMNAEPVRVDALGRVWRMN
jgi:CRISPR-associated endonuclease Csn1